MLKIKKGIKKKIKGKKDKEEDLFDPENLAKFKKELEESRQKAGESGEGSSTSVQESNSTQPAVPAEDDEWAHFKQLTAGIDVTLKKTSGDLDRIKTTSYYQKKVSASVVEEKKVQWEDVEKAESDFHQDKPFSPAEDKGDDSWGPPIDLKPAPEELKFQEVEKEIVELEDGLFDTSYLDAIESGQIQLAYIPESPVEEPEGDDPFDTSAVADVVKKIQEEEVKEKRKVNLGGAVDFLTKKVAPDSSSVPYTDKSEEIKKTKRGRPVHVNLLGFDENEPFSGISLVNPSVTGTQPKASPSQGRNQGGNQGGLDLSDLVREFETVEPVKSAGGISNLDLLTETEVPEEKEDEDDVWFRTDTEADTVDTEKVEEHYIEVDPFDTSVVEKLGFGKSELRLLEDELLPRDDSSLVSASAPPESFEVPAVKESVEDDFDFDPRKDDFDFDPRKDDFDFDPRKDDFDFDPRKDDFDFDPRKDDFDFDPRKDEAPPSLHPLDIIHPDSTFDTQSLTPQQTLETQDQEIDPFDTSSVSHIVIPGKSELRLLEDEFISRQHVDSKFGDDLDNSVSTQVQPIFHPLDEPNECINEILELHHPPLQSQPTLPYSGYPTDTADLEFEDPFDTSDIVNAFAPGKNELKELESELLNSTVDFVPPRICPLRNFKVLPNTNISSIVVERQESVHPFDSVDGDGAEVGHHRPLSPQVNTGSNQFEDPFDTSAVTGFLPGRFEAKLLEEELASASFHHPVRQLTIERTENTFSLPANIPIAAPLPVEEEVDPFDTSIADSVVP